MLISAKTKHLPSLRSRLLIAAAVWLSVTILAAGYLVPNFIKSYLVDQEKQQLFLYLDELTAQVDVDANGRFSLPSRLSNPRFQSPYSGLYWALTVNGTQLRSRSLWDTRITGNEKEGYTGPNNQSLLVVTRKFLLPEIDEPVELAIAANQDKLLATIMKLTHGLWIILLIMAVGILILTWLQVSWSLWPLKKLQNNLKQVREGVSTELTGFYPVEVRPVIDDLNALFFHYQELLERARNHAGNLSHALKTPIAVLNNEVGLLEKEKQCKLTPPLQQLQQHIDYHLGRARMAGAANILAARTAPATRVDAISMAMDKVYAHRNVVLVNELDSDLNVAVEKRDLDEIIGNLIENSYKWSNQLIRVHQTDISDQQVSIIIEDDGPGIDESMYEPVLKRGIRLDETTPGTGLGLNIVSELAHSYRGNLTLGRSELGGLKAELSLPLPRI
ncbi:ATP-binding protein [uncultured Photobacterium sp.]|uniref:ATP-binding protein n=1 Tax=uncultured Photobacterium sp. TaxID=173973 RepID=UPI002616695F|nr:ATP-binding protein [uncultured Photobacterium sp.]